jgi:hypothetical protein
MPNTCHTFIHLPYEVMRSKEGGRREEEGDVRRDWYEQVEGRSSWNVKTMT